MHPAGTNTTFQLPLENFVCWRSRHLSRCSYYCTFYRTQLRSNLKRIALYIIRWAPRLRHFIGGSLALAFMNRACQNDRPGAFRNAYHHGF